jgi:hypothetical protein
MLLLNNGFIQIGAGQGKVGLEGQSLPKLNDGLVHHSLLEKGHAEVVQGGHIVRLDF